MRASVIANRDYKIATIDDRLYGAFLEHLGRAIYALYVVPLAPSAGFTDNREDRDTDIGKGERAIAAS